MVEGTDVREDEQRLHEKHDRERDDEKRHSFQLSVGSLDGLDCVAPSALMPLGDVLSLITTSIETRMLSDPGCLRAHRLELGPRSAS